MSMRSLGSILWKVQVSAWAREQISEVGLGSSSAANPCWLLLCVGPQLCFSKLLNFCLLSLSLRSGTPRLNRDTEQSVGEWAPNPPSAVPKEQGRVEHLGPRNSSHEALDLLTAPLLNPCPGLPGTQTHPSAKRQLGSLT